MDGWIGIKEISDILTAKEDTILKRLQRGSFTMKRQVPVTGKGARNGLVWQIHIDDPAIPSEARDNWKKAHATKVFNSSVLSANADRTEETALIHSLNLPDNDLTRSAVKSAVKRQKFDAKNKEERRKKKELDLARFNQLPEKKQKSALAKYEILKSCERWLKAAGYKPGSPSGVDLFAIEYNSRTLEISQPVLDEIKKTSRRSIFRWRTLYNEGGLLALADDYKSNEGKTNLTKEQQALVISMKIKFPGYSLKRVTKALAARNMPANVDSVRRFIKRWLKMNASLHLFLTSPDEWKSRHMFAFGDASETVSRLNQLWEMDSTPADIMLTDGRYTVIGCIDVYSRRFRLLVSPTSKAVSVAALIRRAIIEWGVAETIKTDNGADYVSAHVERVLEGLEIEHFLCDPFSPEQKPHIERALKTFSHGIVELLPGYIGHSVTDRKAIEARRSFSARLMKKDEEVEIKLTSLEFQKICDRWVDAIYMHDSHAGLGGKTPAEMVREWAPPIRVVENERALDILLHPAPVDGGYRTVAKKGVRVDTRNYISPDFAGWEAKRVMVRMDETDLGHVFVYSGEGEFICVAECPEWRGISAAELANHAKARQAAIMREQKKELKELTRKAKVETVPEDILTYREDKIATIMEFPKQTVPHITPALEEAAKAALERDSLKEKKAPVHIELPPEVLEFEKRQEAKVASLAEARKMKDISSPLDVYYLILDKIKAGIITHYEMQWKEAYEHWSNTGKKVGLFKEDQYCLHDPDDGVKAKEADGTHGAV